MATYYVDLNLTTNGHSGTETDPFSLEDYLNLTGTTNDDIFYFRGMKEITIDFNLVPGKHKGWNLREYGPWRVKTLVSNLFYTADYVSDCIIDAEGFGIYVGEYIGEPNSNTFIRNAIIYSSYLDLYLSVEATLTFEGCVFIVTNVHAINTPANNRIIFRDCIFIRKEVNEIPFFEFIGGEGYLEVEFYNCVCSEPLVNEFVGGGDPSQDKAPFYITACQENWDAPQWPSWDGSKEEFSNPDLFAGITSPPQPGNPPYTGYETDLFGNPRTGIGTGCFYLEEEKAIFFKRNSNIWENYFRLHIIGENVHRDTKFGNPLGDIVDNSSGENKVKNINKGPVRTVTGSWLSVQMSSRPMFLYK